MPDVWSTPVQDLTALWAATPELLLRWGILKILQTKTRIIFVNFVGESRRILYLLKDMLKHCEI